MSDLYVRKMKTFFQRLDFDKDGAITRKDFEDIADRFVARETLDATRGAELKQKLTQAWEKYFKDPNSQHALNQDAFVALLKTKLSDPSFRDMISDLTRTYFVAVDANADGGIQLNEYELFFEIIGIDKALAKVSFQAIDTNNDGELSVDEFVAAGVDFFFSEKEDCPSKFFWGPIV